jgi:prephenate dehydrogenase
MHFSRLALIGCGLIGGSFALGLKKQQCVGTVVGFSASESSMDKALALGVIDAKASSLRQAVEGADLVLVAVPVNAIEDCLRELVPHLSPQALVMDVGSTKARVAEQALCVMGERAHQFVPAHPIAGKEQHGVEFASADLFVNHKTILTPLPVNATQTIELASEVWVGLGSEVLCMSAQEHDQALAGISHLPHFIAFAAVNALNKQAHRDTFWRLAGPGFRDFSRIAASSPTVWRDIFVSNPDELLVQLKAFQNALQDLELALQNKDQSADLHDLIEAASLARKAWSHGA